VDTTGERGDHNVAADRMGMEVQLEAELDFFIHDGFLLSKKNILDLRPWK
jgi:hypothetical protein